VPSVTINWGDGSSTTLGTVAAARAVTHTYSTPGIYTITADATGQGGDPFSTATTQTVTSRPGPTISASATTGTTATTFVFTVTPATATSPSNVVVDFGDGSSTELGAITSATTVSKRYSSTGSFTVRATQTEASGSSSSVVVVTVS
jgi:PKD repeat protein